MTSLQSVIYPSLPPYVTGEATGELTLSSGRIHIPTIANPHLINVSFTWWGQHEDPVVLPYGRKSKVIFPLRTDLASLQTYLADMHEFKIDVHHSGELLGHCTIPLRYIINTKVNAEVVCSIKSKSRGSVIGQLSLHFVAKYRNTTTTPATKIDLTSVTPTKSEKKISDFSRVEALVVTDNSNKFPEWPQHRDTARNRQNHNFQPERAIPQHNTSARVSKPVISQSVKQQALRVQAEHRVLPNTPLHNEASFDTALPPSPPPRAPPHKPAISSPHRTTAGISSSAALPDSRQQPQAMPEEKSNGVASILDAAESLLSRIKQSRNSAPAATPITPNAIADMLVQSPALAPLSLPKLPPPMLTQIDWLLRGVPEAYDDTYIDDETLDRIINGISIPVSDADTTPVSAAAKNSKYQYEVDMMDDALAYVPTDWYMRKPVLSAPVAKPSSQTVTSHSTQTLEEPLRPKNPSFREIDVQTSCTEQSLLPHKSPADIPSISDAADVIYDDAEELSPTQSEEPVLVTLPKKNMEASTLASSIETRISVDSLLGSVQSLGTNTTLEGHTDIAEPLPIDSLEFLKPNVSSCHDTSHILEIMIEGRFDALLRSMPESNSFQDCLGCYCHYSFPGLTSESESWQCDLWSSHEAKRSAMLWWDSECAVLNSRNHHQFTVKYGQSLEDVLGISTHQSIAVSLYPTDMEGGFDRHRFLGIANLPKSELLRVLDQAGCARSIRLAVTTSSGIVGEVTLHLSHRIVPVVFRSELPTIVPVHDTDPTLSSDAPEKVVESEDGTSIAEEASAHAIIKAENGVQISVQIDDVLLEEGENATTFVFTCASMVCSESKAIEQFVTPSFSLDSIPHETRDIVVALHQGQTDLRNVDLIFSLYAGSYSNVLFGNVCLGSAVVDLSPLAIGFGKLHGWYHIMDAAQRSVGQMLVQIGFETHESTDIAPMSADDINDIDTSGVLDDSYQLSDIAPDFDLTSQVARLIEQLSTCNARLVGSFLQEEVADEISADNFSPDMIEEGSISTVELPQPAPIANDLSYGDDHMSVDSSHSMLSRDFYEDESSFEAPSSLNMSPIEPEIIPAVIDMCEELPLISIVSETLDVVDVESAVNVLADLPINMNFTVTSRTELPSVSFAVTPPLEFSPIFIPDVDLPLPVLAMSPESIFSIHDEIEDSRHDFDLGVDNQSESPAATYSDDFEESVASTESCVDEQQLFIRVQANIVENKIEYMIDSASTGDSDNLNASYSSFGSSVSASVACAEAATSTGGLLDKYPLAGEDFSCQVNIFNEKDQSADETDEVISAIGQSACRIVPESHAISALSSPSEPVYWKEPQHTTATRVVPNHATTTSSDFDAIARILENTMKAEHISWDTFPGQRRRFADRETERISRIMLGKKICKR